jgi:transposase
LTEAKIFAPAERRRIWGAQEKAGLLTEVDAEGGKVRMVARRHGISESLLYNWRSARKAAAVAMGATEDVEFIAVGAVEDQARRGPVLLAPPDQEPSPAHRKSGSIEIALPNGARISVDASVNEKALSRVLRAVNGQARSAWRPAQRSFSRAVPSICATGLMALRRRHSK